MRYAKILPAEFRDPNFPEEVRNSLARELENRLGTNKNFMDNDLDDKSREWLMLEVKKLRGSIREHRDSSGHDLCWHHPKLWDLLPEKTVPNVAVPPWPQFMRGCVKYRESLERELPNAPVANHEAE